MGSRPIPAVPSLTIWVVTRKRRLRADKPPASTSGRWSSGGLADLDAQTGAAVDLLDWTPA